MNVKLLKEVRDFIVKHPRNIDMRYVEQETPCGTVACIAGWTLILNGVSVLDSLDDSLWEKKARRLLKLSPLQSGNLFYRLNWPIDILDKLSGLVEGSQEYANVVAERIDRLANTNT